jgi:hypothetical protein
VKLLKGKRLRPDSPAEAQPAFFGGALLRGQASVGSDGWLKTLGMCRPLGRLIAEGVMRPVGTEERAFGTDAGVMVVSDPS